MSSSLGQHEKLINTIDPVVGKYENRATELEES